jgi:uncharacterized membrane protein (TIGR02234 family)
MSPRRELVVVLAVIVAGAGLVLLAATQPWAVVADPSVTVPPSVEAGLRGQAVAPGARALGLVGLAGVVALLATRRIGRRVVAVLLALAGVATCAVSLLWSAQAPILAGDAAETLDRTWWCWVSVAGGVLVFAGGVLAALRSGKWPAMGSRYDAPAGTPSKPKNDDPWAALDRGEDPTA